MVTLFHCDRARSLRALWIIEEIGLPCDLRLMAFPPRLTQPDYLALNPLGTVPLLIDGEVRMTESAGICEYLATRYAPATLGVSPCDPEYGEWLEWLYFGEASLTWPLANAIRWGSMQPPGQALAQVVDANLAKFASRVSKVAARLQGRPWLLARGFTAADVSVAYALFLATAMDLVPATAFPPAVQAYWARCQARPAWQRARARSRATG